MQHPACTGARPAPCILRYLHALLASTFGRFVCDHVSALMAMTFGHTICDRVSALLAMTFGPYLRNIDFTLAVMTFDCLRSSTYAPLF